MAESALTGPQLEVLHVFFDLPESVGFVLAGGAGLLAAGISTRPTEDVDLFTTAPSVADAGDALEDVAQARGWTTGRIHDATSFRRLVVHLSSTEQVLVDLAQDGGPLTAPLVTTAGPTYPPEELGARKVLALFDRAELRDFVDVANVTARYGKARMLSLAAEIDAGFDRAVFRDMASTLDRFTDEELSLFVPEPAAMRRFFSEWLTELR